MQYDTGRFTLSYGETGFTLELFANGADVRSTYRVYIDPLQSLTGTTGKLSKQTLTSIFRDQRFPDHWYRRSEPANFTVIGNATRNVFLLTPEWVVPGSNDGKGNFIPDATRNQVRCFLRNRLLAHLFSQQTCIFQKQIIAGSIPGVLVNTTGILKQNVDFLISKMNSVLGSPLCPDVMPSGPAGI
jgi:hypothetical protein